jgi:hypothetical protein
MATRHPTSLREWFRRFLAAGCAALVLALTVFAASPAAHDWLHVDADGSQSSGDDACAVALFSSGVALPVGPIAVPLPLEWQNTGAPGFAQTVCLISPRYLRQPERGPPALA